MIRTELAEMIALAERLCAVDEPAILATLFSVRGSTYRPLGSMMVAGPGASFIAGGISGGCLEESVARRGRLLSERNAATLLTFDTDPGGQNDGVPALGCGGSIEVLIERFTPEHLGFLRQLAAAHERDTCSTVACVLDVSAAPRISVQRMLWVEGGCPPCAAPQLESLRQQSLAAARSRENWLSDSQRALVCYVPPLTRLVILGAGNDARALCHLARSLGWHITVADRRARLATRARFPDADQIVAADWWSAVKQITFTSRTAVVLMTHSFADDVEILPLLDQRPLAYVGSLGPDHRLSRLREETEQSAGLSQAFAAELRGPIGLDLGERSAAGIAVSIVAEILAELNGRTPLSLSRPARSLHRGALPDEIHAHG